MDKESAANEGDSKDAGLIPGWEDSLEQEMATHFIILAWKISRRSLADYIPWSCKESDMTERLNTYYKQNSGTQFYIIKLKLIALTKKPYLNSERNTYLAEKDQFLEKKGQGREIERLTSHSHPKIQSRCHHLQIWLPKLSVALNPNQEERAEIQTHQLLNLLSLQ